jgi:hypothetical protein
MRYFLDTEFLEDGKIIDLISIGIVSEDHRSFYAISSECDMDRVLADPWLRANVWPFIKDDVENGHALPRAEIARQLLEFVHPKHHTAALYRDLLPLHSPEESEFWGFNCAYDWVALRQLFGRMIDCPRQLPYFCHDIKQYKNFLHVLELPRIATGTKHNALDDAFEVKQMFEFLRAMEYKEFGR